MKPRFKAWYGGECPVRQDSLIEFVMRNGEIWWKWPVDYFEWKHFGTVDDIIAYRVIEENDDGNTQ